MCVHGLKLEISGECTQAVARTPPRPKVAFHRGNRQIEKESDFIVAEWLQFPNEFKPLQRNGNEFCIHSLRGFVPRRKG